MEHLNIPINKGNYPMETEERIRRFEAYRGEGWEEEYARYRADWVRLPREGRVSEYPLLVDLELASICNLKCPMCYTITEEFKKKVNAKLMDYSLVEKVLEEIGGKVPALRLSLRGEATLHPRFLDAIRLAKEKGIKEVSFLTNGGKFSPRFFRQVVEAGADWITLSIDGLGETYERIRAPIKFHKMLENIKAMKRIKEDMNVHRPVIKVQSVWPAIRENPQAYYDTFAPYVDCVAYNPLIDYLGKDEDIVYDEDFACPQFYQRLVIGADGRCMMCSNDEENRLVVGNANQQSVYEIWHGPLLNAVREAHNRRGGFMEIEPCRRCYLPRRVEENETAVVNGQPFAVKNYVNRPQVVGQ